MTDALERKAKEEEAKDVPAFRARGIPKVLEKDLPRYVEMDRDDPESPGWIDPLKSGDHR